MRIDLDRSKHRSMVMKLMVAGLRWYVGTVPGPLNFVSWRWTLFHRSLPIYINRGVAGRQAWSRGEAELFAAFISKLNSCHF